MNLSHLNSGWEVSCNYFELQIKYWFMKSVGLNNVLGNMMMMLKLENENGMLYL